MASAYEQKRKLFDTLQRSIVPLAELLDRQMPNLPEPSASGKAGEGSVVGVFLGKVSSRHHSAKLSIGSMQCKPAMSTNTGGPRASVCVTNRHHHPHIGKVTNPIGRTTCSEPEYQSSSCW